MSVDNSKSEVSDTLCVNLARNRSVVLLHISQSKRVKSLLHGNKSKRIV